MIVIIALLLTVVLGAQHVEQTTRQSSELPDVLAMISQQGTVLGGSPGNATTAHDQGTSWQGDRTLAARAVMPKVVHRSGTLTEDESWDNRHIYVIDSSVRIPAGVTVHIAAGSTVAIAADSEGIVVAGGSLQVEGTSVSPVVFGEYADGQKQYHQAVTYRSGSVSLDGVIIESGVRSVLLDCDETSGATVRITASLMRSGVRLQGCQEPVRIMNTTFNVQDGPALEAVRSDVTGIKLSGEDTNMFLGSDHGKVFAIEGGGIPAHIQWTVSGESGVVMAIRQSLEVYGDLELRHGVAIKGPGSLDVFGGLVVNSQGYAVSFTSLTDDSVGGDSNNDGYSAGTETRYPVAIRVGSSARIQLHGATFNHVQTAVSGMLDGPCVLGPIAIDDSMFLAPIDLSDCAANELSITRTTFTVQGRPALTLGQGSIANVLTEGPDANLFWGDATGRTIVVGTDETAVVTRAD